MKISVVVPTLNAGKFLPDTLTSITQQKHRDYEVIVVDGGSTDCTLEIAYLTPNTRVIQAPAHGEPNAINIGLKAARGDIVAWLDADDTYEPDCFTNVNHAFTLFENIDWLYGKCRIIDENGIVSRRKLTSAKELFQKRYSYTNLLLGAFIAQPATFFRKQVLEEVGFLDETERLAFDYDYWLRLGQLSEPGFIDAYLANWRAHPASETAKDLLTNLRAGLRLSLKYSPGKLHLRPFQYSIYWLAMLGYKRAGVLTQKKEEVLPEYE